MKYAIKIFLMSLLAACGNGDGNNSINEPVDSAPFVQQLVASHCERVFSCCAQDELDAVFLGQQVASQDECESALTNQLNVFFVPALDDAQSRESVTLDASQFVACGGALKAQSCSAFFPGEPTRFKDVASCTAAFSAELETSGFCQNDFECKTDFCSRASGAEQGTCKNPPLLGEACENDRCSEAFYCDPVNDVCVEKVADGEPCAQNEACVSGRCTIENAVGSCESVPTICTGN